MFEFDCQRSCWQQPGNRSPISRSSAASKAVNILPPYSASSPAYARAPGVRTTRPQAGLPSFHSLVCSGERQASNEDKLAISADEELIVNIIDFDWPGTAIAHGVAIFHRRQKWPARSADVGAWEGHCPGSCASTERLNLHETGPFLILPALDDSCGNRSEAALRLGISRRTLQWRVSKFNLPKRSKKES